MSLSYLFGKRILLLQGPVGPFFKNLSKDIKQHSGTVYKLNFNGGDQFFYSDGIVFNDRMENFPSYLHDFIIENNIDTVVLFGDCRPIHQLAKQVVYGLNIDWMVFEEGYLRPNHVTLEIGGVNGFSELPSRATHYLDQQAHFGGLSEKKSTQTSRVVEVGKTFWYAMLWAVLYYLFSSLNHKKFSNYVHHRPLTLLEALPWIKGAFRKYWFRWHERGIQEYLINDLSQKYYLVPLQTHNDAQLLVHSDYSSIEEFIAEVMHSFAENAPHETFLVLKQHPFDRGYREYSTYIDNLATVLKIQHRIFYIHDQYLPALIEHSIGVVVINSTVGMSAIETLRPVKVCGQAVYNLPEISVQSSLDDFWEEAVNFEPKSQRVNQFLDFLMHTTQYNGSFYRRISKLHCNNNSGVIWDIVPEYNKYFNHLINASQQVVISQTNSVYKSTNKEGL